MNKVRRKLFEAKRLIANTPTKKQGKNTFSKYDYFTPSQVSKLVFDACAEVGLVTCFDLVRGEYGYSGKLIIYDIDSDDMIINTMATEMPEMKAANVTQQLGATATYVQRYLEMATFGIVDNNLDPDTKDNRPKAIGATIDTEKFQTALNDATTPDKITKFLKACDKYELSASQKGALMLLKS